MKKVIKVALFRRFRECAGYELPKGCPKDYKDFGKRHLLAEWLEHNASNEGPFIVEKQKDGSISYEYLSGKYAGDDELGRDIYIDTLTRLVVVEVDSSRPWGLFDIEGPEEEGPDRWEECIYYLDHAAGQNQVIPEVVPVDTASYRRGEEVDRERVLEMKEWRGNVWSVELAKNRDSRRDVYSTHSVKDTIEMFNQWAAWGMIVDTFSFEVDFGGGKDIYGSWPKGIDALLWLKDRAAIDPDFRLPKKVEALTERFDSSLARLLEELYGKNSAIIDLGHGKIVATRKEPVEAGQKEMDGVKMNFKEVAGETLKIITEGEYEVNGRTVVLPQKEGCRFSSVEVYSPDAGRVRLSPELIQGVKGGTMCRFTVTNEDSFRAAGRLRDSMVLNFASARHPGGGFLKGASAQEESLCRCSTLFASLSSKEAEEMYRYNNEIQINTYSDYMLFSPYVVVFRDAEKGLLEKPFFVSVASVPAPNRSAGARYESEKTIRDVLLRRIRRMLVWAVKHGTKNLVLGAWGCGVFWNDPEQVASCFKQALVSEGLGYYFDEVCFAVYGKPGNPNLAAFEKVFA